MIVPVNFVAVFVSGLVGMFIGYLWYGVLFGKLWMKLSGVQTSKKPKGMGIRYTVQFVLTLLMAFVLAHSLLFASSYLKIEGIEAGLSAAIWNWLGFIVPVSLGAVIWEGKSFKLWILNSSLHLIKLMVMGIILALWV